MGDEFSEDSGTDTSMDVDTADVDTEGIEIEDIDTSEADVSDDVGDDAEQIEKIPEDEFSEDEELSENGELSEEKEISEEEEISETEDTAGEDEKIPEGEEIPKDEEISETEDTAWEDEKIPEGEEIPKEEEISETEDTAWEDEKIPEGEEIPKDEEISETEDTAWEDEKIPEGEEIPKDEEISETEDTTGEDKKIPEGEEIPKDEEISDDEDTTGIEDTVEENEGISEEEDTAEAEDMTEENEGIPENEDITEAEDTTEEDEGLSEEKEEISDEQSDSSDSETDLETDSDAEGEEKETTDIESEEERDTEENADEDKTALKRMQDYMNEHQYGREDGEIYKKDPEWQQLNQELQEEDEQKTELGDETSGEAQENEEEKRKETAAAGGSPDGPDPSAAPGGPPPNGPNPPTDAGGPTNPPDENGDISKEDDRTALERMRDYMYEHNYGREDGDTYKKDPEWQKLNEDLMKEDGILEDTDEIKADTGDGSEEYGDVVTVNEKSSDTADEPVSQILQTEKGESEFENETPDDASDKEEQPVDTAADIGDKIPPTDEMGEKKEGNLFFEGTAYENPQFGEGGGKQFFIRDAAEMKKDGRLKAIESEKLVFNREEYHPDSSVVVEGDGYSVMYDMRPLTDEKMSELNQLAEETDFDNVAYPRDEAYDYESAITQDELDEMDENTPDTQGLVRAGGDTLEEGYKQPASDQENSNQRYFPDPWKNPEKLKEGETYYQVAVAGKETKSSYFTDLETVNACREKDGNVNLSKLFQKLQINPGEGNDFELTKYEYHANENSNIERPPLKNAESEEIDDNAAKGEMPEDVKTEYQKTISHTPVKNGEWTDKRGESTWIPNDAEVKGCLARYGKDGIDYKEGFAELEPFAAYEAELEQSEFTMSNSKQFKSCNEFMSDYFSSKAEELAGADSMDPLESGEYKDFLMKTFQCDADEVEEIQAALELGETPYGYTWHHDTKPGRMLLVPTMIHSAARHRGGQSLWGGGAANR